MTSPETFNKDYFENGVSSQTSLYENYRWMPEVSIPMACRIRELFPGNSILDFGCAKGFLVYALRLLDVQAFGYDISNYAYENSHPNVKQFLINPKEKSIENILSIDTIFIKDVLEHIPESNLRSTLKDLRYICKTALFIIPFGDNGTYRISDYSKDKTHIIAENEIWWQQIFISSGFRIKKFTYYLRGFKENWIKFKNGNGFYFLE